MDFIAIQVQDTTGNWPTFDLTRNNSTMMLDAISAAKIVFHSIHLSRYFL